MKFTTPAVAIAAASLALSACSSDNDLPRTPLGQTEVAFIHAVPDAPDVNVVVSRRSSDITMRGGLLRPIFPA